MTLTVQGHDPGEVAGEISVLDHVYRGVPERRELPATTGAGRTEEPVTRMEPRAVLAPSGFPDFLSRTRVARPGRVWLEGRAWPGWAPEDRVEVSVDDGVNWVDA